LGGRSDSEEVLSQIQQSMVINFSIFAREISKPGQKSNKKTIVSTVIPSASFFEEEISPSKALTRPQTYDLIRKAGNKDKAGTQSPYSDVVSHQRAR